MSVGLMFRKLLWAMFMVVFLGILAGTTFTGYVAWEVYFGDHSELEKSTILAKIREETTLYYLDGTTRIGSIFESRHRRYVPIEEMPAHLINAVVAAEDKNFYHHIGIDPSAIFVAGMEGLMNKGKFRRGGSTITQQTVKNIVDDWEPSFTRKFREMIRSLQLERLYSKRQIIEFYLNQFHVAGNGNGAAIAAKYYFNKDVHDLDLVEAAFVAGSVKGPSKYNPFIQYTKKTRARAISFANERKNYVLSRMYEQSWLTKEEYKAGVARDVPFNRGEFRSAEVTLVDLVRSQLNKAEVLEALGLESPDQLNTAGLRVFTTIDADIQNAAQMAVRRNLSHLETTLSGFRTEPQDRYRPLRSIKDEKFVYGKVEKIEGSNMDNYEIHMTFGLPTGVIPNESLIRFAKLLDLADGKGVKAHMQEIVTKVKPGDVLFAEVKDHDDANHRAVLELSQRPNIGGGLITLDKGEVRAVVSGFDTLGYNRAIYARRQPGSAFKSVVFFAALQLGWSILDGINNTRQIFPYQGKFYFPRYDHVSPYEKVSMLWAGTMSENLASVALGATLVDRLNFDQYKELMNFMGYLPKSGESAPDFHFRVAKSTGVSIDNEGLKAYQLKNAINEIAPDLVFAGEQRILSKLQQMWWGNGYLAEIMSLRRRHNADLQLKDLKARHSLVANNYLRIMAMSDMMKNDWRMIQQLIQTKGAEKTIQDPAVQYVINRFRVLPTGSSRPRLGYFARIKGEEDIEEVDSLPLPEFSGRSLNLIDLESIWGTEVAEGFASANISPDEVELDGYLPGKYLKQVTAAIDSHYKSIQDDADPYHLYSYFQHHDFRIGLGLQYQVRLAQACGTSSPMEPVLSFALGSNAVTVSEVAKIYQTFVSGKTYRFFKEGPANQITFIKRIEDRAGHVLYEPKAEEHQLVQPKVAYQMREILSKVITHGTGRRARGELFVNVGGSEDDNDGSDPGLKIRIPSFGKTGTTNDFRTSYFAGFLPYPDKPQRPLDPENSYVIASYVGYDMNKIMQRGRTRIYGSNGGLPIWTDLAKEIITIKEYKKNLDTLDLKVLNRKEWPVVSDSHLTPFLVDLPRGLIMRIGADADTETWRTTNLARTGEDFQNPYELGSSVNSIVNIYSSPGEGGQPQRMFSLFNPLAGVNASPEEAKSAASDGKKTKG